MVNVLHMLSQLPTAAELLVHGKRARDGDLDSIEHLRVNGLRMGLNILAPNLGDAATALINGSRQAVESAAMALTGQVVDAGEFREVPPYERFLKWLIKQPWGTVPIFGTMGSGKTWTALRLAEVLSTTLNYPVYGVNLYEEDRPEFVKNISMAKLISWCDLLREALDLSDADDDDELLDASRREPNPRVRERLEKLKRRIILIDEASMVDAGPMSKERKALKIAMTQGRHLEWWVLYMGQMMEQVPLQILNSHLVMCKEPAGNETFMDKGGRNLLIRTYWQSAIDEFNELSRSSWYVNNPDRRAWTWVMCRRPIGNSKQWSGMVPFLPPGSPLPSERAKPPEPEAAEPQTVEGEFREVPAA